MRRIRPDCLVLAELELWPNLILAARAAAPAWRSSTAGSASAASAAIAGCGRSCGPLVRRIDLVAAQNDEFAERFRALGAAHECGSRHRLDQIRRRRDRSRQSGHARLAQPGGHSRRTTSCFWPAARSSPRRRWRWTLSSTCAASFPRLRLILVPRHPERFDEVAALLAASGVAWQRRSQLDVEGVRAEARVLLVDTVGELGAWWGTAAHRLCRRQPATSAADRT